jgi:nucleoid-associated protein YgaU
MWLRQETSRGIEFPYGPISDIILVSGVPPFSSIVMAKTGTQKPGPLEPRFAGSQGVLSQRRVRLPVLAFSCAAIFGASVAHAQDVAEAARQERARKESQPKRAKHVYTEEDLARPHILVPEDGARAEAQRNACTLQKEQEKQKDCPLTSSQNPPANLNADSLAREVPLGDVARKYRREKELQAQKELLEKELQALKPKQASPFHLPIQTPAFATPVLPNRPADRAPLRPPQSPAGVRRDPFRAMRVQPLIPARPIERARPAVPSPAVPSPQLKKLSPPVEAVRPEVLARPVNPVPPVQPVHPAQPERIVRSRPVQPALPEASVRPVQPVPSVQPLHPAQPERTASAPIIPSPRSISVQPGDSLWRLARQNLGRGERWHELLAANPRIVDPNNIRAGTQIALPAVSASAATPLNIKAKIKAHKGDTLWKLAKANLGKSSYWPCLARANPVILDPNLIYENQELLVPQGCVP